MRRVYPKVEPIIISLLDRAPVNRPTLPCKVVRDAHQPSQDRLISSCVAPIFPSYFPSCCVPVTCVNDGSTKPHRDTTLRHTVLRSSAASAESVDLVSKLWLHLLK